MFTNRRFSARKINSALVMISLVFLTMMPATSNTLALSARPMDVATESSVTSTELRSSHDSSLATAVATTDPLPEPHPEIAAAATSWANNAPVMTSYQQIQTGAWSWHFTPNSNLIPGNNFSRPLNLVFRVNDQGNWNQIYQAYWLDTTNYKIGRVIENLAERQAGRDIILGPNTYLNAENMAALQAGYDAWPSSLQMAFYGTAASTCNIYVGDVLFTLGIDILRSDNGHYQGAGNIYAGEESSVFVAVTDPLLVQPGDIVTWPRTQTGGDAHIEIVTGVDVNNRQFESRGGGRANIGQPKTYSFDQTLHFFRVRDQFPYGIRNVSTIPDKPSYKSPLALFDGSTSSWAIINYVAGETVSVTLEFSDRMTLSGFSIGLGGDPNVPNAYSLTAVAADSLDELNAGRGATYQTVVQNVPTPALEHVTVSFPHNSVARFFRFAAVRNEYSRHVHISELTPLFSTSTPSGSINGTLSANSSGLADAYVQACTVLGVCYVVTTDNVGYYAVSGLKDGSYLVTAFPPASTTLLREQIGPLDILNGSSLAHQDLALSGPTPPPPGTMITSRSTTPTGLPIVYWAEPLILTTTGCSGGTATYSILQNGVTRRSGSLAEGEPSGTYTTTIEPLAPLHDEASIEITISCPNSTVDNIQFDMYIDPSGTVTTVDGIPIAGVTMTLYRSENRQGPFELVPDGSALMSPMNRHNPDSTDGNGHFGWDVLTGYYKVRAEKPGCTSPDDPDQPYVESAVLNIPPAVTDLELQLDCPDNVPPTITATASPLPNAQGWHSQDVTLTLTASDEEEGSGVQDITYSASGAQAITPTTVPGNTASFLISTEGSTTVTYWATDNAGNSSAPQTLMVQLDKTAPAISIARPLAQAYTHTMSLNLAWTVDDPLSGVGESAGQLDGNAVSDGQTLDLLSLGLGAHTLMVSASDLAGNAGQQSVTFTVTASMDSLSALVQQACTSGAITRREACVALKTTLRVAQGLIQHGKYALARQVLRAFNVELLAILKGHWMDQATYERLKAEALFVINALPR